MKLCGLGFRECFLSLYQEILYFIFIRMQIKLFWFGIVLQGCSEQKMIYKLEYVDDMIDVFELDVVV